MAKSTYKLADSPDEPIYNGRFVISSANFNPESKRSKTDSSPATDKSNTTTSFTPEERSALEQNKADPIPQGL
jgi:hypothetical protein